MLALLPVSVLSFGGVHLGSRIVLAVAMAVSGVLLARRSRYVARDRLVGVIVLALLLSALPLLPVSYPIRAALQGQLGAPVVALMQSLEVGLRPLALDPHGAVFGLSEALALMLLGIGVAGWATRAGRVRTLVWTAVGTGVGLVVVMGLHTVLGLESIYGMGLGTQAREGFFAPFVNLNHGGIYCAAVLPLALSMAATGMARERTIGVLSVAILSFGVWAASSRGAALASVIGLLVAISAIGGHRVRVGVAAGLSCIGLGVAVVGAERSLAALTQVVAPSVLAQVEAGHVDLTTGRVSLFSDAMAIVREAPLLGVGTGGFDLAHRMVRTGPSFSVTTHAHSEPLQLFAEHGVLVGSLVLVGLFMLVSVGVEALEQWSNRQDRRWMLAGLLGSLAALGFASLVDFPLRLLSHSILAVSCLGALIGLARPSRGGRMMGPWRRRWIGAAALAVGLGLTFSGIGLGGQWGSAERARADGQAWWAASNEGASRTQGIQAAQAHFGRAAIRGLNRIDIQWLARTQHALGASAEAANTLEIGTRLYPSMPWLWRDRARVAQRMGAGVEARDAWARMLALDLPQATDPLDVIREALFGGDFETPIIQARAILPERADRYRQAAQVMDQLGLVEESETLFRHARSIEPEGVVNFAAALIRWDRPADAVMLLEAHRKGCRAQTLYAHGLGQIDRAARAAEAYVEALSTCGAKSWALRVGLAKARLLSGDQRGEDVVRSLLAEREESHSLRRTWLWVLSQRGRTVEGVKHLEHLKYSGVIRPVERTALQRAREGLPFKIPRPSSGHHLP
jgi:tetratricopeptide (TPR) repeat protein